VSDDAAGAADQMSALILGVDPSTPGWSSKVVERLEDAFQKGAHPAIPWFALKWARDHGIEAPGWVIDYLCDRWTVMNAVLSSGKGRPEASAIGQILGFGAAGPGLASASKEAAMRGRDFNLACWYALERARHPGKTTDAAAAATASQYGVTTRAVYRARELHGSAADEHVEALRKFCS
jgi:hypothetical protein